jgi:membrane protease YdiL (CAAX protease family)
VLTSTETKQSSPERTGLSQFVRRHPLAAFLVLTYGLTWALWIPLAIFRDAASGPYGPIALLLGSNIPSAVAIVLTAVGLGKSATRKLLGRLLIWRVGWQWYLVLLAPTALVIGTISLVAITRGGPTAALAVPLLSAIIAVAFMTFPGSALGEEIGWRGFALPRLQFRRTALTASLVVGSLHGLWHLPLWLNGNVDHPLSRRFLANVANHCDLRCRVHRCMACCGVRSPRHRRGRSFSSAAMLWNCSALQASRSVPFGKYFRSNPLMFSFAPRCQGECGSAK